MESIIGYYILTLVAIVIIGGLIMRIIYYTGLRDAYNDVDEELSTLTKGLEELIDKYENDKETD